MQGSIGGNEVTQIGFLSAGDMIDEYNPKENNSKWGATYEVGADQEIIGVYGNTDKRWFSNFGFIVKQKRAQWVKQNGLTDYISLINF